MSTYVRTSPPGDFRRKPRRKRVPAERDFAIHAAHRAAIRTQRELAAEFQLSQSRIAQILRRVDTWLKSQPASGQPQPGAFGREQIAWRLEQERLESIFQRAVRGYDRTPRAIHSSRKRSGPRGQVTEQTRREVVADPQLLKVALRASREKQRLSRGAEWDLDSLSDGQRYALAFRLLVPLRRQAEDAGSVPRSRGGGGGGARCAARHVGRGRSGGGGPECRRRSIGGYGY